MTHTCGITSSQPLLFTVMLDYSLSMNGQYIADIIKAVGLAQTVNRVIHDVIMACNDSGRVRDAVYFGAISYNGERIRPAFKGALADEPFVPASRLATEYLRLEDLPAIPGEDMPAIPEHPVWIEPEIGYGTPMAEAFDAVAALVASWIAQRPGGPPPAIIHVTDGEPTTGSIEDAARRVLALETADGPVTLFNVQLERHNGPPILFPNAPVGLNPFGQTLFEHSSPLPKPMADAARAMGIGVQPGARAFVLNARLRDICMALLVASRAANR